MADTRITRRGMLGATAALPLLAVAPAVAVAAIDQRPDPVLAAAARWDEHQAAYVSWDDDEAGNEWWGKRDYELFEEAAQMPATTKQGMAAKLRMAQDYTATDWPAKIMAEAQAFLEKVA